MNKYKINNDEDNVIIQEKNKTQFRKSSLDNTYQFI